MTLVLTEVSTFGVAMAADSAVTFSSRRVYIGAQKLLPIPQIDAGLSIWGQARICDVDADIWLQEYIRNEIPDDISLWNMAENLAQKLNREFDGIIGERMGIHVGGFDERNGVRGPAFYHIHNAHYHIEYRDGEVKCIADEEPPIREFRAHDDHPPRIYEGGNFPIPTRNGDFSVFGLLYDKVSPLFGNIHALTGLHFPFPNSLAARGEYLRFWINTIKEIYRLSNARMRVLDEPMTAGDAHIGGPVTVLTISEHRIESFYSK